MTGLFAGLPLAADSALAAKFAHDHDYAEYVRTVNRRWQGYRTRTLGLNARHFFQGLVEGASRRAEQGFRL